MIIIISLSPLYLLNILIIIIILLDLSYRLASISYKISLLNYSPSTIVIILRLALIVFYICLATIDNF